jgi:glycosyltransferase involved in cell wall biosynthesis
VAWVFIKNKKMNNPKISIIMSVYNSERFLAEAIESILGQTFKEFEFIIINDCSTDNSLKIINEYKRNDERIRLIENSQNIGLTKSLNLGIKVSKGRYIARIDADDIALNKRLEIQYNYLEKNKDIFLIGAGAYNFSSSINAAFTTIHKPLTDHLDIKERLYNKNCIYHPTIMFRNEKFLYREKFVYAQDYDFYLLLLSKNKNLSNIAEPLNRYRINDGAISWVNKGKQKLFGNKAKEFYHQKLKYGKDEYDNFNPNEILNIDVENTDNKVILESEIKASFKLNNFKRARLFCKKYFKSYGYLSKWLKYYLASFFGRRIVNILRRIIF